MQRFGVAMGVYRPATNEGGCELEKKIMRKDEEMLTYNTVRLVFFVSSLLILDGMMVTYGCDLSTFCSVCAFFNLQTSRKDHGSCCKLATFMLTDLQSLHLGSSWRNGQCSTWCTSHPPWCSRRPMGTHVGTTIGTAFRAFPFSWTGDVIQRDT